MNELCLILASMAAMSSPTPSTAIRRMVDGKDTLPSLRQTQEAAERALRLEPEHRVRGWSERARNRAWLPRLDVRAGTDTDLDVRGLGQAGETWTEGRGFGADVALRWGLGEIVFSDAELRINRERLARASVRSKTLERVTKVYFERVAAEFRLRSVSEPSFELLLEVARLDGLLAAATLGAWKVKR